MLAYVTGTVEEELLAQNEYLIAENRILKAQLQGRLKLSDAERATLGEIAHRLGRKALAELATVARPGAHSVFSPLRPRLASQSSASWSEKENSRPGMPEAIREPSVRFTIQKRPW